MRVLNLVESDERNIGSLSHDNRPRQVTMATQDLGREPVRGTAEATRSINELHGLGVEVWTGVDALEYADSLRDEWDRR